MLWLWILCGAAVWLVLGVLIALTVGRGVRLADDSGPHVVLPDGLSTSDLPPALRAPCRVPAPVPLPPFGIALVLGAIGLETAGYLSRLTGGPGALSMDDPFSLPRLFVAALFAGAAVAAVVGARIHPRRLTWWLAVAAVGVGIAAVKGGGSVHVAALGAAREALGAPWALLLSVLLAAGTVAALWQLSRHERRDRRRVLSALSFYAVAVVGLSALSTAIAGTYGPGSGWAATATFVEESAEALAGVAYLFAVLVGVAPRLVLPAAWRPRRRSDAGAQAAEEQRQRGWSPSR